LLNQYRTQPETEKNINKENCLKETKNRDTAQKQENSTDAEIAQHAVLKIYIL